MEISLIINGRQHAHECEARETLADFIRERCRLTALHLGCEHGACGACSVVVDGVVGRSCLLLAAACEGAEIYTLEGLRDDAVMQLLKRCFHEEHALQCGYCTPGMLIIARDMLKSGRPLDEKAVRLGLAGHLCRCTGYQGIVAAILRARRELGPAADSAT